VLEADMRFQLVETDLLLEHVHHIITIPKLFTSCEALGAEIQATRSHSYVKGQRMMITTMMITNLNRQASKQS